MTEETKKLRSDYLRLRSALFDRITGLPALPLIFDDLRTLLDRRRVVGLLHVSVPSLLLVESVYGWQTFDRIVASEARALSALRGGALPQDAILAQVGIHGAELIVAIPARPDGSEVDAVHLQQAAREVEAALARSFSDEEFATIVPRLEPSVGFAIVSENPFFRFERLVYRAVEEAREHPLRREKRRRRSWSDEIQQVIREEGISVLYQPIVELATLEVIGYEALSRGPEGSALESPALLFQLSRESGQAAELDRLCRRLALVSARGIGPRRKIFLNTRLEVLADPDWRAGRIEERLAALGLSSGDLVVEIPEMGASSDEAAAARFVEDLRARGFRFAIDDIGTGYSGIQAIERLRPDYIKIDISLVHNIDTNLLQQDLLRSLVTIGSRVGAAVIAEGIESERELEYLRASGARFGQGYLFSRAMPGFVPGPIVPGSDH